MNKSLITNLVALLLVLIGLLVVGPQQELLLNTGLFALSGGLTNWLAVYMLFEKVPGFYGSGVIPERFEEFKHGIKELIMEQFFNAENIDNFFKRTEEEEAEIGAKDSVLTKMVDAVDLNSAFDSLVEVIMASSFGSMLSMLGGAEALKPLKEPFMEKMKAFLLNVGEDKGVLDKIKYASAQSLLGKVETIVDQRLEELSPQLVKEIIQSMIRKHLGWLVVWGGVLGGLIGLLVTLLLA